MLISRLNSFWFKFVNWCILLIHSLSHSDLGAKPGRDRSGIRGMLTVGRNLDRTKQNPYLLTFATLILSKLSLIFSHLLLFYSDYSYLFPSKDKSGFHTLKSCT
jgi:hypothetical protein